MRINRIELGIGFEIEFEITTTINKTYLTNIGHPGGFFL